MMGRLCDTCWNHAILGSGGSVVNEKAEGENHGGTKIPPRENLCSNSQ